MSSFSKKITVGIILITIILFGIYSYYKPPTNKYNNRDQSEIENVQSESSVSDEIDVDPNEIEILEDEDIQETEVLEETETLEEISISNIINEGYVNYFNGLTYYSREDGIYTLDKSYNRSKLIDIDYPMGINIVNDEIIFYTLSIGDYIGGDSNIYKANIDGTNLEKISVIEDYIIYNLMVHNDKIYFIEEVQTSSLMFPVRQISSMDLMGNNKTHVLELPYRKWVNNYFIINNEMFLSHGGTIMDDKEYHNDYHTFQKMNMDTKEKNILIENIAKEINYKDGYVYFTYAGEESSLYRYNLHTGLVEKILNEDTEFYIYNSINFTDDFIYFADGDSVYRINYDGSNKINCGDSMKNTKTIFSSDKSIWGYASWNKYIDEKAQIAIYSE